VQQIGFSTLRLRASAFACTEPPTNSAPTRQLGQVFEDSWDDDSNGGKLPTSVLASSISVRRETAAVLISRTGRPR
jgi:hypothetical protein